MYFHIFEITVLLFNTQSCNVICLMFVQIHARFNMKITNKV